MKILLLVSCILFPYTSFAAGPIYTHSDPEIQREFQELYSDLDALSKRPAFFAYSAVRATNVTGDGTIYTVVFSSESFDLQNNFSNTTFTVPRSGIYALNAMVIFADASAANSCELRFNASSSGVLSPNNVQIGGATTGIITSVYKLVVGETVVVQAICMNTAKIVDITEANTSYNGSGQPTFFSGILIN